MPPPMHHHHNLLLLLRQALPRANPLFHIPRRTLSVAPPRRFTPPSPNYKSPFNTTTPEADEYEYHQRKTRRVSLGMEGGSASRRRRPKLNTAYSKMTIPDAEERLNIRLSEIKVVSVHEMLANAKHSLKKVELDAMREKVYDQLVDHLRSEGSPIEADVDFNETNVSDLVVYCILASVLSDFRRKSGRNVQLTSEKEIISRDDVTGGKVDFVIIDSISLMEDRVVLVLEGKQGCTVEARKQCLLAMKDCWDNNDTTGGNNGDAGVLYGFITTGEVWSMIRYDGGGFEITDKFTIIFEGMREEKERWLEGYSIVVDCLYCALSGGGCTV